MPLVDSVMIRWIVSMSARHYDIHTCVLLQWTQFCQCSAMSSYYGPDCSTEGLRLPPSTSSKNDPAGVVTECQRAPALPMMYNDRGRDGLTRR
jgi:hypothetical protein